MRIIALVGADGTGKSTQAQMLAERLAGGGFRAVCVRPVFLLFDPWRLHRGNEGVPALSPRVARLRRGSKGPGRRRGPPAIRLVAGYVYALASYAFLRALFRREEFVVCDRYFYQFFYDLVGPAAAGISLSFPRPDMAFWLDADLDLVGARLQDEPVGPEALHYYESVLRYYRDLAPRLRFLKVDAASDRRAVAETIWTSLLEGIRRPTN